ncbi:MAG: T9SS type A sorting domain-containing protein [Bacteroidetes bacterium]|nr:T9SS type A sorting domain-containing protein [Bacteroidota bacterium]
MMKNNYSSGGTTGWRQFLMLFVMATVMLLSVNLNSANAQYCAAAGGTCDEALNNVTFAGINNSSPCGAGGYTDWTSITGNVTIGLSYPFSCQTTAYYGGDAADVWIDWNQNNLFTDAGEYYTTAYSGSGGVFTTSITVPGSATAGNTRMRVRMRYFGTANVPCGTSGTYGEVEDYNITVAGGSACVNPPTAGSANSSSSTVCPSTSFNLTLSGNTIGTGQTYQWQSSPDNSSWANIGGATSSSYSTTQAAATYYRCEVTCGTSVPSTEVFVNINPFTDCYCASGATNAFDEEIYEVNINGAITPGAYSNTNGCSTPAPGLGSVLSLYSNFKTLGAFTSVYKTTAVPFSIFQSECDGATYYPNGIAIFVDYNQDGVFDMSEQVFAEGTTASGPRTVSGSFVVPGTALTGVTGMRVICAEGYSGAGLTGCLSYGYGETEDYLIDVQPAPLCTEPPVAGTISGSSSLCVGANGNLTLTGYTLGTTIQWQSSPDNSTWTNIGGANLSVYSITSFAAPTYYRAEVTCVSSVTSASWFVDQSAFLNCYCTANLGGSCGTQSINSVAIATTTLNNPSTCVFTTPVYAAYPASGSTTATLLKTVPYSMTVGTGNNGNPAMVGVWIDANQNGIFEATEYTQIAASSPSGGTSTASITVPATALTGQTGMRVRSNWELSPFTSGDACSNFAYGETEDYIITIDPAPICTDPPLAGSITGSSSLCIGASTQLTLSGYSLGTTLQWQSSSDNVTFANIAGETNPIYNIVSFSSALYYRVEVTCANPTMTSSFLVSEAPFYNCYCIPTNAGSSCMTNVTFNTLNNTTPGCPGGTNYASFPATTTVLQGASYPLSITLDASFAAIGSIWIDYNHDGIYDASEWTQIGTNMAASSTTTISILIPLSSLTGTTGMRIRTRNTGNQNGAGDACLAMGSGETEDYTITIDPPPPCTEPPSAGTINGTLQFCSGGSSILTLSGYDLGSAVQWQTSPDNATWSNIGGAINSTYTATSYAYFRAAVTCVSSSFSASVQITQSPFSVCYCASAATVAADEEIFGVTLNGNTNSSSCATTGGPGSVLSLYSNYTNLGTFFTVQKDVNYPISVNIGTCGGNYSSGTAIYIDYNQNGSYGDPGEQVYGTAVGTNGPHIVNGSFTVPSSATLGVTGMRVINAEGFTSATITPCLSYGYGETEDYLIDIQAAPVCVDPPVGGTATTSLASVCSGSGTTLGLTGQTLGTTYQWQESSDNINFTNISGATNSLYVTAGLTANTYFRCEVTCVASTPSSSVLINVVPCINQPVSGTSSITTCAANYYDSGGPSAVYQVNETSVYSICPNPGNQLKVVFSVFNTEAAWDALYIHDGPTTASPLFASANGLTNGGFPAGGWWGTTIPGGAGGFTSTDVSGCLTFEFLSDGSQQNPGWQAVLSCISNDCAGLPVITGISQPGLNCPGTSTLLEPSAGSSGGNGLSYLWEESDDNGVSDPWASASGTNNNRTYITPTLTTGMYYRQTMSCSFSGLSATSSSYEVQFLPEPIVNASSNSPICESETLYLTSSNDGPGQFAASYLWNGPGGFNDVTQNPQISGVTNAFSGTYTVEITNNFGCTASNSVSVAINNKPTLSVVSNSPVTCNGGLDGAFTIQASNGAPTYLYTNGIDVNIDGIFSNMTAGSYVVNVTDDNGCSSELSVDVTEPDPTTTAVAGSDQSFCATTTATLAGNTALVGVGSWSVIAGSATVTNPSDPNSGVTGLSNGLNTFRWTIDNALCANSNFDEVTIANNTLPTASISGTQEICNGNSATLSLVFTGSAPYTYSYSNGVTTFGPFTTSSNPENVLVAPSATRTYTVVSVDDNFCSGTVSGSAVVTVTPAPPVGSIGTLSGPSVACVGQVLTVSCNAVSGATGYTWSGPAGTLFNGQPGPVTTLTNSVSVEFGILAVNSGYDICVKAVNACGQTNNKCMWVRGLVSTPAPISGQSVSCPLDVKTYSVSPVVGAANYFWTATPQMQILSGQGTATVTIRFLAPFTTGSLCVTAVTSCGASSAARCMTVSKSLAPLGALTGSFSLCPGQTGQVFSIPAAVGASTYAWTVPANVTIASGQGTPSISVNVGAGFTSGNMCVTVTSSCGVSAPPRCKTISSTFPALPGNMSGNASGVCGQTIIYSIPSSATVSNYNWTVPSGASIVSGQGTNSISVSYTNGFTTGQICVNAQNGCGTSPARCINVKGVPADLGVISGSNTICSFESGVQYQVTSVFGATSFVWTVPAGATIIAGQGTNTIFVDFGIGAGQITVKAANSCGQSGTRSLNVIVNCKLSGNEIPGAIVSAYPNPVSSDLTVDVETVSEGTYSLELTDLSGRVVFADQLNAVAGLNKTTLDVSNIAKGMYMLSVRNNEGFTNQIRIAVE